MHRALRRGCGVDDAHPRLEIVSFECDFAYKSDVKKHFPLASQRILSCLLSASTKNTHLQKDKGLVQRTMHSAYQKSENEA